MGRIFSGHQSDLNIKGKIHDILIFVFSLSFFFLIFVNSQKIRPVADDFCFADSVKSGVFRSVWNWYLTWVGDLAITFFNTILVGLPIENSVKLSFIPFIAGSLSVACVGLLIIHPVMKLSSKLFQIIFLFSSWCTFLWFPALSSHAVFGLNHSTTIAEQSTFWGVVNSSYVIPICMVVGFYLFSSLRLSNLTSYPHFTTLVAIVSGFVIGLSGYVLAFSVIGAISLTVLKVYFVPNQIVFRSHFIRYCCFFFSVLSGLSISLFAPGVSIRKANLPSPTALEIISHIPKEFFLTILTFCQLVGSLSFLVATISGFILYDLGSRFGKIHQSNYLIELTLFLFLVVFVNRMSELFSYAAISHLQMGIVLQFFLGLSAGIRLGQIGALKHIVRDSLWVRPIVLFVWVGMGSAALIYFWYSTSSFLEAWNLREAYHSLPGYADGWISVCAKRIID